MNNIGAHHLCCLQRYESVFLIECGKKVSACMRNETLLCFGSTTKEVASWVIINAISSSAIFFFQKIFKEYHQNGKTRYYRKVPKFSDTKTFCYLTFKQRGQTLLFCQNGAKGIANSEDPDQTAPIGAVWSGSALFADLTVRKLRVIILGWAWCFVRPALGPNLLQISSADDTGRERVEKCWPLTK